MGVQFAPDMVSNLVSSLSDAISKSVPDRDNLVLVGILSAGFPIAERIAKQLAQSGQSPRVGKLDVSLYRDDLDRGDKFVTVRQSDIPFRIDDQHVILVDDVMFHGRTIRAALDGLQDFGRPKKVEVAVLIERGHRELPIEPTYVGQSIETQATEHVSVKVLEIDGEDQISVENTLHSF